MTALIRIALGVCLVSTLAISSSFEAPDKNVIAAEAEDLYTFYIQFRGKIEKLKNIMSSPEFTPVKQKLESGGPFQLFLTIPNQVTIVNDLANRIGKLSIISSKIKKAAQRNNDMSAEQLSDCLTQLKNLRQEIEGVSNNGIDFQTIITFDKFVSSWRDNLVNMGSCQNIVKEMTQKDSFGWEWLADA